MNKHGNMKRILSIILSATMTVGTISPSIPVYAKTPANQYESIEALNKNLDDYFAKIEIDTDNNIVLVDGEISSLSDTVDISEEKEEEILDSNSALESFFNEDNFSVEKISDNNYIVTDPYQLNQIIVITDNLSEVFGATRIGNNGNNIYLLEFDSEESTMASYEKLKSFYGEQNVSLNSVIQIQPNSTEVNFDHVINVNRYANYKLDDIETQSQYNTETIDASPYSKVILSPNFVLYDDTDKYEYQDFDITYQWYKIIDDEEILIEGATESTFSIGDGEHEITFEDDLESLTYKCYATIPIQNLPDPEAPDAEVLTNDLEAEIYYTVNIKKVENEILYKPTISFGNNKLMETGVVPEDHIGTINVSPDIDKIADSSIVEMNVNSADFKQSGDTTTAYNLNIQLNALYDNNEALDEATYQWYEVLSDETETVLENQTEENFVVPMKLSDEIKQYACTITDKYRNTSKIYFKITIDKPDTFTQDIRDVNGVNSIINAINENKDVYNLEDITVAVIDTGFTYDENYMTWDKNRITGYYNVNNNVLNTSDAESCADTANHGSKVLDIIATSTPDNVKFKVIKICDNNLKTTTIALTQAFDLIKNSDIDIINCSFDFITNEVTDSIRLQISEIYNQKKIMVVASGINNHPNSFANDTWIKNDTISVNSIDTTVAKEQVSFGRTGTRLNLYPIANFTSFAYSSVEKDFVAAGVSLKDGNYEIGNGNSYATAIVSAQFAIIKMLYDRNNYVENPDEYTNKLREFLSSDFDGLSNLENTDDYRKDSQYYGYGYIDMNKSICNCGHENCHMLWHEKLDDFEHYFVHFNNTTSNVTDEVETQNKVLRTLQSYVKHSGDNVMTDTNKAVSLKSGKFVIKNDENAINQINIFDQDPDKYIYPNKVLVNDKIVNIPETNEKCVQVNAYKVSNMSRLERCTAVKEELEPVFDGDGNISSYQYKNEPHIEVPSTAALSENINGETKYYTYRYVDDDNEGEVYVYYTEGTYDPHRYLIVYAVQEFNEATPGVLIEKNHGYYTFDATPVEVTTDNYTDILLGLKNYEYILLDSNGNNVLKEDQLHLFDEYIVVHDRTNNPTFYVEVGHPTASKNYIEVIFDEEENKYKYERTVPNSVNEFVYVENNEVKDIEYYEYEQMNRQFRILKNGVCIPQYVRIPANYFALSGEGATFLGWQNAFDSEFFIDYSLISENGYEMEVKNDMYLESKWDATNIKFVANTIDNFKNAKIKNTVKGTTVEIAPLNEEPIEDENYKDLFIVKSVEPINEDDKHVGNKIKLEFNIEKANEIFKIEDANILGYEILDTTCKCSDDNIEIEIIANDSSSDSFEYPLSIIYVSDLFKVNYSEVENQNVITKNETGIKTSGLKFNITKVPFGDDYYKYAKAKNIYTFDNTGDLSESLYYLNEKYTLVDLPEQKDESLDFEYKDIHNNNLDQDMRFIGWYNTNEYTFEQISNDIASVTFVKNAEQIQIFEEKEFESVYALNEVYLNFKDTRNRITEETMPQKTLLKYKDIVQEPEVEFNELPETFIGWFTEKITDFTSISANLDENEIKNASYEFGNEIGDKNLTLYALYKNHVTIDYSGASNMQNIDEYVYPGKEYQLPELTKEGYTFMGWEVNGVAVDGIDSIKATEDKDIKAIFTENEYEIQYIIDDNVETFSKVKYTDLVNGYNVISIDSLDLDEKYTRFGWYCDKDHTKNFDLETIKFENLSNEDFDYNEDERVLSIYGYLVVDEFDVKTRVLLYNPENEKYILKSNYDQTKRYERAEMAYLSNENIQGYEFKGFYETETAINENTSFTENDLNKIESYKVNENKYIFAVYEPKYYTITYVINNEVLTDDEIASFNLPKDIYQDEVFTPVLPTKENYTFDGWYDTTGDKVNEFTVSKDITLIGDFNLIPFTITFVDETLGKEVDPMRVTNRVANVLPKLTDNQNKLIFDGWYTSPNGEGDKISTTNDVEKDTTLYANWIRAHYIITMYVNGEFYQKMTIDYNVEQILEALEREHYSFNGWYDADGNLITVVINKDADVYGELNPDQHTITFEGADYAPIIAAYDSDVELPKVPTGMEPWHDEDGNVYNDTIHVTKDITLTCVDPDKDYTYTITFVDEKYNKQVKPIKLDYHGSEVVFGKDEKLPTLYQNGDTFVGWYDNAGNKIETPFLAKSTTLFARWSGEGSVVYTYTVSFVDEVEKNSIDPITIDYQEGSDQFEAPVELVSRSNRTFVGWFTEDDEKVENLYGFTKDITLYAKWDVKTYNVTFTVDDISETVTVQEGAEAIVPEVFTKEGYYVYWDKFFDNVQSDLDVHGVWKANTYKIYYKANGGSGSMSYQTVTYDQIATLKPNAYKKTNYEFAGWALTSKGEVVYEDLAEVINLVPSGKIYLYAIWTKNVQQITVNFHLNYDEDEIIYKEIESGTTFDELPIVTRENYVFKEWNTEMDGSGTKVTNKTPITGNEDFYAIWCDKPNGPTITVTNPRTGVMFVNAKSDNEQKVFYEIQYSNTSNFRTYIKKTSSTGLLTVSNFKGKTIKYVRARSYIVVNGIREYSDYSEVVRIVIQ